MAPPKFDDLGKSSRDLFSKGYNFGFLKVSTKTKSDQGVEFGTAATHNVSTGRLLGSIDFKYKLDKYGATFQEKWNTDNLITTELNVQDYFGKGTKCIVETAHSPLSKMSGRVRAEYKTDRAFSDLKFDPFTRTSVGSVTINQDNFLLGGQVHVDFAQNKMTRHVVAVGHETGDMGLHAVITDANDFGASVYHKVNPQLEIGATLGYHLRDQTSRFGLAGLYKLDSDTEVRAKVASTSQLGVSLQHRLKPGLKVIASSLVNLQNFNDGGHKVGLGLEFES